MTERRILHTLVVLFGVAAIGQLFSAVPGIGAMAARLADEPGGVLRTDDGIVIVDQRAARSAPVRLVPEESEASAPVAVTQKTVIAADKAAEAVKAATMAPRTASAPSVIAEKAPTKPAVAPMQRQKLADMYAKMPATKSAKVLSSLTPGEAAAFIGLMPQDAGAEVLAAMPSDTAVAITREVLRYTQ